MGRPEDDSRWVLSFHLCVVLCISQDAQQAPLPAEHLAGAYCLIFITAVPVAVAKHFKVHISEIDGCSSDPLKNYDVQPSR